MSKVNFLFFVVLTCTVWAEPEIYFGEDLNPTIPIGASVPDRSGRLADYPHAKAAHGLFMNRLIDPISENFESFASGVSPSTLHFNEDTATFTGDPYILGPEDYFEDNTMNGVWPTSGEKCLLQHSALGNTFQVDFSSPQAAFGFYATDIEVAELHVTLVTEGGESTEFVVHDNPSNSGSVLFWGIIDIEKPFIRAVFARVNNLGDGFGFDDMTIGRVEQVCRFTVPGDLNIDCKVNLEDLAVMAGNWLVDCTAEPVPSSCIPRMN